MYRSNQFSQKHTDSWHSPYNLGLSILALGLGLFIGWLDLYVTEVVVTIFALLSGGFLLGVLQPVAAWRWPIFIVIGLPIMEAAALAGGWQTAEPVRIDMLIVFVALAFALSGTYIGVVIRYTVRVFISR